MAKIAVILLAVLFLGVQGQHFLKQRHGLPPIGPPQARARAPILRTITQRVNHFNPRDTRTWSMRYYSNNQFYLEGGPIFIMIGGEWEIYPSYLMTGLMFDMAAENNGYMFYPEHRFYGDSHPTEDHSSENLLYLSTDQALADLAYFIDEMKTAIPGGNSSRVVVVGGSYAGTLATWARIKYPHLIDAAWSSSGPLRASPNFYDYFEHIGSEINRVDQSCHDSIQEAMGELMSNLATIEGIESMTTLFNACDTIDISEPEISYFLFSLAGPWAHSIQYAAGSITIQDECDRFNSFPGSALERYTAYIRAYYGGGCISDLEYFISWYTSTAITSDIMRQWAYQCCSEVGWLQTGTGEQPFAYWSNEFVLEMCGRLYDIDRSIHYGAVNRTNIIYGSVYPEVTRLVSVHGSIDPWMRMGVLEDINEDAPVIVVPDASHCADLSSISDWDTPEMIAAKTRIKSLIKNWIS